MSTIQAKQIERNCHKPDGRNYACAPPANHTCDEVCCLTSGGRT